MTSIPLSIIDIEKLPPDVRELIANLQNDIENLQICLDLEQQYNARIKEKLWTFEDWVRGELGEGAAEWFSKGFRDAMEGNGQD